MMRLQHVRKKGQEGQAIVEFTLIATILIVLLLAIAQFGIIWSNYVSVTQAAREGARRAVVKGSEGQAAMITYADQGARQSAANLKQASLSVSHHRGERHVERRRPDQGHGLLPLQREHHRLGREERLAHVLHDDAPGVAGTPHRLPQRRGSSVRGSLCAIPRESPIRLSARQADRANSTALTDDGRPHRDGKA